MLTILKISHICIIFSERKEKIPYIKQNIHESIYDIITNMNKINPPVKVKNEETINSIDFIVKIGQEGPNEFTPVRKYYVKYKRLQRRLYLKTVF